MSRYVLGSDWVGLETDDGYTIQCDVKFSEEEYVFRATENYESGEEVFMSYGAHPNDFLLAECEREHCSV